MLDVMDLVNFLGLLYDANVAAIPRSILIFVMVFTCATLLLPTIAIVDFTKAAFGNDTPSL